MLENIKVLCHSSIKIEKEKTIYIDPFRIDQNYNDADIIFITHSHYDHYSEDDIKKIKKEDTVLVVPKDMEDDLKESDYKEIIFVEPQKEYEVLSVKFETVSSYNVNKKFHPKENNWVGYILNLEGKKYYIAGDTDITKENKKVKCDVAFLPVDGVYTMTCEEAAKLANIIKPQIVVPIHFGEIVGTKEDAQKFVELLSKEIKGIIL